METVEDVGFWVLLTSVGFDWVYCFDFSNNLEIENTFYGRYRGWVFRKIGGFHVVGFWKRRVSCSWVSG